MRGERGISVADPKTREWSAAHREAEGYYSVRDADEAFFRKQAAGPVVSTILAIGRAQGRPLRILEIGCGSGADSVCLALAGHDVTTLDVSDHLLEGARQLAKTAARLFPDRPLQLRFVQGDIFDLEEYAGQYDVVLSFDVTVIWPEEAKRLAALANLRAALKEEGWLLYGTTNTANPLFKLVPVRSIVADLAVHSLAILEHEVRATGLRVIGRGALGLSEHFEQWLASPLLGAPLRVVNWVFERLPRRLQLLVAPHVFVVARLPGR